MSTVLNCSDLRKAYPSQDAYALGCEEEGVSLSVDAGELFALLGPSGCGKTTTLRIIGGFITPDTGQVTIDGVDVTRKAPYARPTNTVFQSYALFPHMSVGQNVAFGLKMERASRAERDRRVGEALELVGLGGQEKRRVSELSGGMQQRAALARAMVKRPAVLLLDEPLGALDLRLRKQMQDELARVKATTRTTFVHVTHDQEEACAIADRIAVMNAGRVVQVDTPFDLYRAPRTAFVAAFINAGTVIRGVSRRHANHVAVEHAHLRVQGPPPAQGSGPLAAVLPPDRISLHAPDGSGDGPTGWIDRVVFTGSVFDVHVQVGGELELRVSLTIADMAAMGERAQAGAEVRLRWAPEDVIFVEDDQDVKPGVATRLGSEAVTVPAQATALTAGGMAASSI